MSENYSLVVSSSESEFESLSLVDSLSVSEHLTGESLCQDTDAFSLSESIAYSESLSLSESEQASQSVSESEFYSLSQSEWESLSESESLSEMISHLLSESESLSLSEVLYLSESESLSQSQQISESLSQSQSVADSVSLRKASLSQSYSMLESEFGSYRQSVAETEVFAHDLHTSERLYKSLSELDMSPLTHQQKVQEVMTPEISEEGSSQTHIAEEQQELENREESIKNIDLQDSLKHLSHYSESNGTNLRMTERQLYHLLRPGSQPLARDLRNVASELSGLAAITQKKEDAKSS